MKPGVAFFSDSAKKFQYAPTFDDLHKLAPAWETTEYSFDPKYKKYPGVYDHKDKNFSERFAVTFFDDGVFDVTPELVDKGTAIPQVVKDMLQFFKIDDVKNGNNYDLGPYETGAKSWIPSSKKDKDRNKYSPEEPVISSAQSFYLSMSLLFSCFFLLILF